MAAKKNPARDALTEDGDCIAQAGAITFRVSRERRPGAAVLAEGQITAQNEVAMAGKGVAERHQQRRGGIRTGAVRQDQRVAVGHIWSVQPASYGGIKRVMEKGGRRLHRIKSS